MLRFIDCNCAVGLPVASRGFRIHSPDDIERVERKCGISAAFAHHSAAFDLHPVDGNEAIESVCANNSFFKPVWVVIPNDTGEFFDPGDVIRMMSERNILMARVFPKYNDHSFFLTDWCAGPLLTALEDGGIPLLLDTEQVPWNKVHELAGAHPKLPIVITNLYYRHGRAVLSLLKSHKNLYCETSGLRSFGLLQTFCEQAGAEHLVFGTGMGVYSAGSAVAAVSYAGIARADKEAIAYGNLCRILKKDVNDI